MLLTRITLRVISGYETLFYIIIIRKFIFVNLWSERREYCILKLIEAFVSKKRFKDYLQKNIAAL